MTDCIYLTGIRAYGYTGYLPEEQTLGQWFEVDVRLSVSLLDAAKSDQITDTVDYRNVIAKVQHLIKTSKFALVETLAEALANSILAECDRLEQVQVILSKPAAPIPDFGGKISVQITRSRITK